MTPLQNESLGTGQIITNYTQSSAAGVYRFENVRPGRYRIQASETGMSTYYQPGTNIEVAETVNVTADFRGAGPNFTMVVDPQQSSNTGNADSSKRDTYAIYSALLPAVVAPRENTLYLIRGKVASGQDLGNIGCTIPPRLQPVWNEVLSDLGAKRDLSVNLEGVFTLEKPYALINDDEIRQLSAMLSPGLLAGPQPPNNPRFQGAKTMYTLSDVFFNRSRTLGLVYASTFCGPTCGNGGWRIFEKNPKGDWAQVLTYCGQWVA